MGKKYTKLANRYAKALLLAVERERGKSGSPTPAQEEAQKLAELAAVWRTDEALSPTMLNPMFDFGERKSALDSIAATVGLSPILARFLGLVFDRDRIRALAEISDAFTALANERAGFISVSVTVARDLSSEEKRTIEASLQESIAGSLSYTWDVDPSILGGMIVSYGGKFVDGSVHGRLERLQRTLMNY